MLDFEKLGDWGGDDRHIDFGDDLAIIVQL
jgi:hypothetical protein